jgi:hypothetical protein
VLFFGLFSSQQSCMALSASIWNQHSSAVFRGIRPYFFRQRFAFRGRIPIVLVSAIGTILAAVAALVSVYMILFDETPPWV